MSDDLATCHFRAPVSRAIDIMRREEHDYCVTTDDDRVVLGSLSRSDAERADPAAKVEDVMSPGPTTPGPTNLWRNSLSVLRALGSIGFSSPIPTVGCSAKSTPMKVGRVSKSPEGRTPSEKGEPNARNRIRTLLRGARIQGLVEIARRAEEAGFSFALISDHYHPWIDRQGESPLSVVGNRSAATGDGEAPDRYRSNLSDDPTSSGRSLLRLLPPARSFFRAGSSWSGRRREPQRTHPR